MLYVVEYENDNMYGKRVVNVAEPELSSDASTKNYVDTLVKQLQDAI